jgi:hypothetical protein
MATGYRLAKPLRQPLRSVFFSGKLGSATHDTTHDARETTMSLSSNTLTRTATLLAVLSFSASPARAGGGTIDATDYLPLGAFNVWEMIDREAYDLDGTKAEHQIISVTKTDVIDGAIHYNVRTKLFQDVPDVLFQFGLEGDTIYLYGVRILIPTEFIDDDDVDVKIPTIFFDPKVPIGSTSTPLGVDMTTNVTASIKVKLKIGDFLDESGTVNIDPGSTVTARWEPIPPAELPINTPLGSFAAEGSGPLARLVLDFFFTYSSPNEDIDDEINDEVTDKSVSGVFGPGTGYVLIDGQGSQQKIVNRVVLPGDLLFNPFDPDSFAPLPPFDVTIVDVPLTTGVVLVTFSGGGEGGITDGTVTLSDVSLEHKLGGVVLVTGMVSAGADSAPFVLKGKAKVSPKTGGLRIGLKGKTKKLPGFAKNVKFSVKQELSLTAEGGLALDLVYNAGKDPITKELITGTLSIPVDTFQAGQAIMNVALPVDIPKIKKAQLIINPTKRKMGAQGTLTLVEAGARGGSMVFPILLLEAAKLKEGFPTKRKYKVTQTGTKLKLFSFAAESDGAGFTLTKLVGKLAAAKVKPDVGDVDVTTGSLD